MAAVQDTIKKLPGMLIGLLVSMFILYIAWKIVTAVFGPDWSTIKGYFPDTVTFVAVIAFLAVAAYGAWKGGGAGSVIFTYIAGFLLIVAVLSLLVFGPEEAGKVYEKFQGGAKNLVENWIGDGAADPKNEPQTRFITIGSAWHEERVPPGKRVCYDPFDKLTFREDTNEVVHYLKSKDDKPLSVHIYHVRYGQPCKKA